MGKIVVILFAYLSIFTVFGFLIFLYINRTNKREAMRKWIFQREEALERAKVNGADVVTFESESGEKFRFFTNELENMIKMDKKDWNL